MNVKNSLIFVSILSFVTSCSGNQSISSSSQVVYKSLELSFSHPSGFYDKQFNLKVNGDHPSEIYFTTDGSEPTKQSNKYSSDILINNVSNKENEISNITNISSLENVYFPDFNVDKCSIYKFKGYDSFGNESKTYSCIYFVGLTSEFYKNIPIVCINTKNDNLFDYEKGIYVTGKTYDEGKKEGYPETYPANYNNKGKDWERPATFTFFNKNHEYSFSQEIGIRIHGGWTRAFNQKSFNLYARKEYSGTKVFEKQLFETNTTKTFMLRSGGYRDTTITKSRDCLVQDFAKTLNLSVQDSYPAILFLNNEYWGIYNMQERYSDTYIEEHYGINNKNVIIVENDEIDEGEISDATLYTDMLSFFKNNDLSDETKYQEASNILDVDDFINYLSCQLIVGNIDWPGNNVRLWRSREITNKNKEDGKWRFLLYDTDDSMDIHTKCSVDSDPFLNTTHWAKGPLDPNCTVGLIFTSLLKNESFKTSFKTKFKEILANVFSPSKVNSYLQCKYELLLNPLKASYLRFVSMDEKYVDGTYFKKEIDKINSFFVNRPNYLLNYLNEHII